MLFSLPSFQQHCRIILSFQCRKKKEKVRNEAEKLEFLASSIEKLYFFCTRHFQIVYAIKLSGTCYKLSFAAEQKSNIDGNEKFQLERMSVFLHGSLCIPVFSPFFPHSSPFFFTHFVREHKEAVFVNKTSIFETKSRGKAKKWRGRKKVKKEDKGEMTMRKMGESGVKSEKEVFLLECTQRRSRPRFATVLLKYTTTGATDSECSFNFHLNWF